MKDKWSNPEKGLVPSPTALCHSYWKGALGLSNYNYRSKCQITTSEFPFIDLCRGVKTKKNNECPGYDTKQSDDEVPMWSTS